MKYQCLVLYNSFLKKIYKWLAVDVVFILIYCGVLYYTRNSELFDSSSIGNLLLIQNYSNFQFIEILLLYYNIGITIYITYVLYIYEYFNSLEFIFLRINNRKRRIFKLLVTLAFIMLLRTIYYVIIFLFFTNYFKFTIGIYIQSLFIYILVTIIFYIIFDLYYEKVKR